MPLPALRNTFFSRSAVVCGACTMQLRERRVSPTLQGEESMTGSLRSFRLRSFLTFLFDLFSCSQQSTLTVELYKIVKIYNYIIF